MRFRFVLLATTALVAATAPARAEPISTAIGLTAAIGSTFGIGAATAGSIGGSILGLGVSLGLSTLSQALAPKPKAGEANSGVETSVQMGGDVPRQIVVGRCAVKGQLVYQNTWGPQNTFLDRIFVLSDWLSAGGLASLIVNGTKVEPTLAASGPGFRFYTFAPYASQLYVAIWDGTQTAADPAYVTASNPAGRWTDASRLTGMTYAAVRYAYAKDVPLYENGIPDLTFEIDGARLYDLRKDSTAGGSGPHRWDDPTTWEPSGNPAVTYNYLRGFHAAASGERLLGMGVPAYDLIAETFIAAANVCDETVTLDGGGTEPRYRCAAILTADEDVPHRQTLDTLLSTFAGYLYDYGGSYFCQAGAAQAPVRTITDADLVVGPAVTFAAKRSRAELVNRIHGQFLDPASGYQPQSYEAQVSATDAATDGEELGRALDLMAVPSQSQAERIAKIRRREARAQASASVTLGFNHVDLQVGDWITWTSARFGTRTWRVVDREISAATRAVTLNLAETNAAVFSWSAVEEGAAPAVPVRLQPGTRISTVSGFGVNEISVESDDGTSTIPGLLFYWQPVTDPSVDSVEIEYRIVGTVVPDKASDPTPGDGALRVTGVVNSTSYEARATIRCTPSRLTTFTPWFSVTTSADYFLPVALAQIEEAVENVLSNDPSVAGSLGALNAAAQAANASATEAVMLARNLALNGDAREDAFETLVNLISAMQGYQIETVANASTSLKAGIDEQGRAVAEQKTILTAQIGTVSAQFVELNRVVVDGQTSTSTALTSLDGRVSTADGKAVAAQGTADSILALTISSTSVLAQRFTSLSGRIDTADAKAVAAQGAASDLLSLNISPSSVLAQRFTSLSGSITTAQSTADAAQGAANSILALNINPASVLAQALTSLSGRIDTAQGGANAANGAVNDVLTLNLSPGSALAAKITSIDAGLGDATAHGEIAFVASATPEGAVSAFSVVLKGTGADTGLKIVKAADGTGYIMLTAGKVVIGDGVNGVPGFAFDAAGNIVTIPNLRVIETAILPGATGDFRGLPYDGQALSGSTGALTTYIQNAFNNSEQSITITTRTAFIMSGYTRFVVSGTGGANYATFVRIRDSANNVVALLTMYTTNGIPNQVGNSQNNLNIPETVSAVLNPGTYKFDMFYNYASASPGVTVTFGAQQVNIMMLKNVS